jgi:hypothetical protein
MNQIRLLAVTGRHEFDEEAFFDAFERADDFCLTRAAHSKPPPGGRTTFTEDLTADAWDSVDPTEFDAVVLYDTGRVITEAQKERFLSLFDAAVGAVFLHHSIISYPRWDEYDKIVGGRYILGRGPSRTGSGASDHEYHPEDPPYSDFRGVDPDPLEIPIKIYAKDHPITRGLDDFVVHDEAYNGLRLQPNIQPLIITTQIHAGNPYGWFHTYRNSRVVYLQMGHGPSCHYHPTYQELVQRCVRWVAEPRMSGPAQTQSSRPSGLANGQLS